MDDDGYLRVVDRKKELIINAGGKNMSPANIENTIKAACPLIGVIIAIGDARPYNTALIVLDAESAVPYAAQRGLPDASAETLAADPEVIGADRRGSGRGQQQTVPGRADQALPSVADALWEPGGDEITLTMKLKRRPIAEKYATEIEELYADEPGPSVHQPHA